MDRGTSWATVHRVTKSWTWLKQMNTYTPIKVIIICDTRKENSIKVILPNWYIIHNWFCIVSIVIVDLKSRKLYGIYCYWESTIRNSKQLSQKKCIFSFDAKSNDKKRKNKLTSVNWKVTTQQRKPLTKWKINLWNGTLIQDWNRVSWIAGRFFTVWATRWL